MKISYNWLKQYLDFNLSPAETEEKLTLLGLEVEGFEETGSDFDKFVVGEVLEVKSHPNADKLQVCRVNLGSEDVQIVCGAKNVAAGQKVPVATIGSTLPVPMENGKYLTIKKAKLRGEVSNGMICSEVELGLGDDHSGILVLSEDSEAGSPLNKVLKNEKDTIFEIGLTPNRPDAACHVGVARDLASVTGLQLNSPYNEINITDKKLDDPFTITIKDPDKCHRYVGMIVEGITVGESPDWLKNRLISIGLRPINNVVDVTNYVLHESGQPLHAFDYHLIAGKEIVVQSFTSEKEFITLDSIKRKVPAGSLFICDGNEPVAIAGVMGGENSEVTDSTTRVLIESAYFEPSSIRRTSKSLALQTDSSYRFERGIDPNIQLKAAVRAARLIAELGGGRLVEGYIDEHPVKTEPVTVNLRVSRVNHLLGTALSQDYVASTLHSLEIDVKVDSEDLLSCTVPTFRPDITREVDLIEEVGRVFDYNNIPRPTSSPFFIPETLSGVEQFHEKIRSFARSLGYKEISTNSLLSGKEAGMLADESVQIQTLNPVSQENTTLRPNLTGGFLKAVRFNLNRNAQNIRLFEMGHTFRKNDEGTWISGVREHMHLLLGVCGYKKSENWSSDAVKYTPFDLKSDLEALLRDLKVNGELKTEAGESHQLSYKIGNRTVAFLKRIEDTVLKGFDLDQEVFVAETDLTTLFELGTGDIDTVYQPIPKFPSFEFDAAFTVDKSVRAGDLAEQIKETAGTILKSVSVFDVYEGKNLGKDKKSIAFRLTFLDSNKTLNIKDVEPVVQKVVRVLEKSSGAKLRS